VTFEPMREKHDGTLGAAGTAEEAGRSNIRLWLRLLSCAMVVEKRLKRRFADQFDTTLPRFDVLAALDRHPEGMTMGALSRSLLVSNGNVTVLVQTLLKDGWAMLEPSASDRRASIVSLTELGRSEFFRLATAHHGWIDGWFNGLNAGQREQLFALLGTLKDSIAAPETLK